MVKFLDQTNFIPFAFLIFSVIFIYALSHHLFAGSLVLRRYKLLDLFSGAGGCTKGYQRAGFYVVGVDIKRQKRYCGDEFVEADALEYLKRHGHRFDAIHASPPCQGYSKTRHLQGNDHPLLIEPVRDLLLSLGKPYVIENVQGAPLRDPVALTGTMFGLLTVRPRLFESNIRLPQPPIPDIPVKHAKMGRRPKPGEYVHVVGHMSDMAYCRKAMGIEWMTQNELAEAIPPVYTEWVGGHLMAYFYQRERNLNRFVRSIFSMVQSRSVA